MVKKSILDRFIKLGGYDLVKYNKKTGKWRGVVDAARKTGIHRRTVIRLLKDHPVAPVKGLPKYVEEFRKSNGYQRFKAKYRHLRTFSDQASLIRRAFLLLNKKDPISWTEKDYETVWNSPKFVHPEINAIPERIATAFHNLMRATEKHDFLLKFKGKKFPKGKKREWFLEDEDIIGLCGNFEENESLLMLALGIVEGARFSSLVLHVPNDFNTKDLIALCREPKVKTIVSRLIPRPVMKLTQKYIRDYQIQGNEKLFKQSYSFYQQQFRTAGKKAAIQKTISTHILKHTFVTQGSRHDISAEIISDQTGTELRTLTAHYRAKNVKKARHELLGEKTDVVSFDQWIESLMPYFNEAYERIKKSGTKYDDYRSRL